jgi:hypothetical protein
VRLALVALLIAAQPALAAPAGITEPQARAFVARQSRAWNAGDLDGYFGLYTPGAVFRQAARGSDNRLVPYGASSLKEARAQARRFFAASKARETSTVAAVAIHGRQAEVASRTVATVVSAGRSRRVCSERVESLVLTPQGLRSRGQSETIVRCRPAELR